MSAELRTIDFYGEAIFLVLHSETGKPYTPVKPLCSHLGITWQPQHAKLKSDMDLWGAMDIVIPSPGGPQTMTCIPVENVQGWLLGIQAARVKEEIRPKLRRYQKELCQVLHAYETTGAALHPEVRAAAPQATRTLFAEIEALTGLNPEAAQPGWERGTAGPALQDWQVEQKEAREAVLAYLLAQTEGGQSLEVAMARLIKAADEGLLPDDLLDQIRRANARAGTGDRTISRRILQRWLARMREGEDLAPKAPTRPEPEWLEALLEELAAAPSLAEAHRRLLERRNEGPSYDAVRRALERVKGQRASSLAPLPAPGSLSQTNALAELFRQARLLFGNREGRAIVLDLLPTLSHLEGGAR